MRILLVGSQHVNNLTLKGGGNLITLVLVQGQWWCYEEVLPSGKQKDWFRVTASIQS